jgi:hypothetical protein
MYQLLSGPKHFCHLEADTGVSGQDGLELATFEAISSGSLQVNIAASSMLGSQHSC